MICDYGCGREAKHQFKNGKWCCEKSTNSCPNVKMKANKSEGSKKRWSRKDERIKQSERRKRHFSENPNASIEFSNKIKNLWTTDEYREKQKTRRSSLEYKKLISKNMKGKKHLESSKRKMSETKIKIYNSDYYKRKYPVLSKLEKIRDCERTGKIQVVCKYCKKWFIPSYFNFYERIRQVESLNGNMKSFLFCCDEHKFLSEYSNRISPEQGSLFEVYFRKVWKETDKSLRKFSYKIKNIELRGNKFGYHLDHKYSIYEGFKNEIDPKIIGHYKNLRIIKAIDNMRKNKCSSINIDELKKMAAIK